ncbi:hypothetical protein LSTR_LSTR016930 [Laodelphax striatellus]|uniref:Uncharacterized protein n=1 Tax=Laodelphax striatellus TaxID=195883 RepID=A0A482X5W8_LAOST|nr:hypothetical protein LSTR_LSTR016930 [Laodelphax striatellus]
MHVLNQTKEPSRFQKYTTIFFRCVALVTFPLSALVPSCLSFYWLCSTSVGLCQNLVLMSPRLKSFAGIPKTNSSLSNPYRHAFDRLQQRLQRLRIGKV